ncbi:hypothetical protein [Hyphomicrobium sp.]|uniref:hypothetical protein n=1 Tax=Hyphomicrobium sp. TaxID=82 RepID=UPI003565DD00
MLAEKLNGFSSQGGTVTNAAYSQGLQDASQRQQAERVAQAEQAMLDAARNANNQLVGSLPGPQPSQLSVDPYVVGSYAQMLRSGLSVPAVDVVLLPDGRQFLTEGHHRYVASQLTGIPVAVRLFPNNGPVGFDWARVKYERNNND